MCSTASLAGGTAYPPALQHGVSFPAWDSQNNLLRLPSDGSSPSSPRTGPSAEASGDGAGAGAAGEGLAEAGLHAAGAGPSHPARA